MIKDIVDRFEREVRGVAYAINLLLVGAWLVALGVNWFQGRALTYSYWPVVSYEAIPVLIALGMLLWCSVYCTVKAAITKKHVWAVYLDLASVETFWFSLVGTGLWLMADPADSASWELPVALVVVSAWSWYVSRWGYLSLRRTKVRQGADEQGAASEDDVARVTRPKATFASIYGNEPIKARLQEASTAITAKRKDDKSPRNGILLHGGPGNGKTVFAEALAGELRLPLVSLTYADVASKWVGEKSARVRAAFEQAKRAQPSVLFIDEVDSFLVSRDGSDGTKEDRDLVNALLTLMVDIRKSRVILIAATNHMDRLDSAGVREGRFDFKVEITAPDLEARLGLLKKGMADNLPGKAVSDEVIQSVAARWNGFSVKRILAVTEELPSFLKSTGAKGVGFDEFMGALRQLQGQRGHVPENVKPLEELVFSENTRDMLEQIVGRMEDPEHTERHGGTLPSGVLFYGPPGTGKTAACKALAKKIGWAYLPATGADLARDPKRLEALYAKAKDLRPTIIFIDEADELMRDRQYSGSTEATNKLLTLMDGVGDRVHDVVWIAATNHPDQIDAALLRGGRFTEKVVFELPSSKDLARYALSWLQRKNIVLEDPEDFDRVAEVIGGASIADAEAILEGAVNRAVSRRETPVRVRLDDFRRASNLVTGGSSQ